METIEASGVTPINSWLVPFLLLGLRDGPYRGRLLRRRISEMGLDRVRTGEMYRVLWEMEREGMVLSVRDDERSLPSRRYELTQGGMAYLEFWTESLSQYRDEIDLFFRLYGERIARKTHA